MCLNNDAAPADPSPSVAASFAAVAASVVPSLKKSASDTCLMAHVDVDDYEEYDAFYVPDDYDDDDTTTLGESVDVDALYEVMSQQENASQKSGKSGSLVDACPPTPLSKKDRNVSFGSLSELSFNVIQGHRSTEVSYPLTLGWDVMDQSTHSIDDYEEMREGQRLPFEDLRVESKEERKQILADSKKAQKEFAKRRQQDRRGLTRRNSMANGMMFGRDTRRNRVQEFLERMKNVK
jgi:hypothetical protein